MKSGFQTTSSWNRRLRTKWGRIRHDATDTLWSASDVPSELVELVERGRYVPGAALDIGSGDGSVTRYLAGFFRPAVGVDLASSASAVARARVSGRPAHFLVADAGALPLRPEGFTLIFDRGCLQSLPETAWPAYFDEIDRLLAPRGVLLLYQEVRANERRARSRIEGGVPPFLERLDSRIVPFIGEAGIRSRFVYALYRKTSQRREQEDTA